MVFTAPSGSGPEGRGTPVSTGVGPPPLRSEGPCPHSPLLPPCLAPPKGTSLLTTWLPCFSSSLSFFPSVFKEKVKREELAFLGHCGWPGRGVMRQRAGGRGTLDSPDRSTSPQPCPLPEDDHHVCRALAASWLGPAPHRRPPGESGKRVGDSDEAAETLRWADDEEPHGARALTRSRQLARKALLSPAPPPQPCRLRSPMGHALEHTRHAE